MKALLIALVFALSSTRSLAAETQEGNKEKTVLTAPAGWLSRGAELARSVVLDVPLMVAIHEANPPCQKSGFLKSFLESKNVTGNRNRALVLLANALVYSVLSPALKQFSYGMQSSMGLVKTAVEVSTMVGIHMIEKVPGTKQLAPFLTFCAAPARDPNAPGATCCASPMVPSYMLRNALFTWIAMRVVAGLLF